MDYTAWGNRAKGTVELLDDANNTLATFPADNCESEHVNVRGVDWVVSRSKQQITAQLPDGSAFVADASPKGFGRAKAIDIDAAGRKMRAINEDKNDWVYVDADPEETKLGQFSGGNNGVRKSYTEFEPASALTNDQKAFLSLVTRTVLEAKLSSFTLMLIAFLILLIPVVILSLL
ncbi:hypothetical protein [Corynebacterium ulcerans]|uniref:Uncharacterized protein n=2 Tax=Corynebacterium ulcerans TaxID=65058 RepID=A0ABD0BG12_CORUL|nr:hypothetical protein [Corynebacterium ulcerans]AEG84326.1 hypothetical protein CULC22_01616 [Corynebacterium ulcerans BR-AD22]AIT89624.1 Hypothetical protein Cul210932_1691 [Corynebacterium ulcerans]AKN77583.1 Hypothetical protein CulFRC58_1729 [Corynebacterium ulcerans FRC58]ALD95412.1 Hypothetical protein Cul131001_1719 [Corynebacterium ulcerans]KPH74820.1 hypothetical protein AFK72_08145 [Corynebacterium ulcerans]